MKLVLGGGLGGLSSSYYLGRKGALVCLTESNNRLGGWVRTEKDSATGVLLETGPHTVRPTGLAGRNTLKLLSELGLTSKDLVIIKRNHPAATKRLISLNSNLYPLPSTLSSLFFKSPPFSKPLVLAFIKDLLTPQKKVNDESAFDFIERRFGKELAEYVISPMLCGICAGDAKEISIKSLLPVVFDAEQNYGSVIKGFVLSSFKSPKIEPPAEFPDVSTWSVWTLKNGLSSLIQSLRDRIIHQGGSIRLSSVTSNLNFDQNRATCDIDGGKFEFNHVISSLPAYSLASLVSKQHPTLSHLLNQIPFASVIVVNLVFEGDIVRDKAFGFLIPPTENKSLLGVIYDTCIYPQGNYTIFTAMLGGRWFDKYFSPSTTESEIIDITLNYLKSILNIQTTPMSYKISISKNCIPQYTLGHAERIEKIKNYINQNKLPLSLVGASYEGVGINDVILSAKKAADNILL